MLFTVKLKLDSEMQTGSTGKCVPKWLQGCDSVQHELPFISPSHVHCLPGQRNSSAPSLSRSLPKLSRFPAHITPPPVQPSSASFYFIMSTIWLQHHHSSLKKIQKQCMPGFRRALTIEISRAAVILSAAYSSRFGKHGDGVTHG